MNLSKKRLIIYILAISAVFFITAGLVKNYTNGKLNTPANTEIVITEPEKNLKEIQVKAPKKDKFRSNDEIKKEYGKLETVYLWNGKSYTGAVINTDEVYSIVTVEGIVNIPMKDVKIREIIR